MTLPTIEEITKQIDDANAKKKGAAPAEQEPVEHEEVTEEVTEEVETPPKVEAKVEEAPKEEKKPDPFSKRFAALTRLDKERRQKEHELQSRIQEFERRQKELETRSSYKPASALDALKHHGYDYDQAVYEVLGAQAPVKEVDPLDQRVKSHLDPLGQKLTAVEAKIKELDEATQRFNAMQEQQAESQLQYALQAVVKDGDYPYISGLGEEAMTLVYDTLVGSYYDPASKQKLTYKQACDKVEGYYKRIGSVNTKKDTVTDTKVPPKAKPSSEPAKTLTHSHTPASPRSNKQAAIDKMGKYDAIDEVAKLIRYHTNQ